MKGSRSEQKKEEIKRAIKRVKMGKKAWATTDESKDSKKNLPTIKILAERKLNMVELDIDMNSKAKALLISIAKDNILRDEKALLNYGFTYAIKRGIELGKKLK